MSCPKFERLIALSVEGDLDARNAKLVQEHLGECAACRELREELLGSQAVLKALNEDAIDPAVLGAVRRRVLERIEDTRPSWWLAWRWKHAVAVGLTAVVLAGVVLWPERRVPPPPAPAPMAEVREPVAEHASEQRGADPGIERRPVRKAVKHVPRKPAPPRGEPLVVKMLTDDPDVVIVWLIDQNGD